MLEPRQERSIRWQATLFGARRGMAFAWAYASVVGVIYVLFSAEFENSGVEKRVVVLLWFWSYGYLFGSIIGFGIGAFTGFLLSSLLAVLVPKVTRHAWLVGLVLCSSIWLVAHFTIGLFILSELTYIEQPYLFYLGVVAYPGVIYLIAGTW